MPDGPGHGGTVAPGGGVAVGSPPEGVLVAALPTPQVRPAAVGADRAGRRKEPAGSLDALVGLILELQSNLRTPSAVLVDLWVGVS